MTVWPASLGAKPAARPAMVLGMGGVLCALAALSLAPLPAPLPAAEAPPQALPADLARELQDFTVSPEALLETTPASAEERNAEIPLVTTSTGLPQPFKAIRPGTASHQTALHCLTEAIYYEAANESVAGKRAVAQTILNRVAHFAYPSSVCGVVYQGWRDPVCQFSYTCDGSLARRPLPRLWDESRKVALAALNGHVETSVGTATHYHADYVLPYWAFRLDKVHVVGRHIFYRFKGRAGHAASLHARWAGSEYYPSAADRQLAASEDVSAQTEIAAVYPTHLQRAPTERRADNDVGGRMNPATGWKLTIPDPVDASKGLQAKLEEQRLAAAASGQADKTVQNLP